VDGDALFFLAARRGGLNVPRRRVDAPDEPLPPNRPLDVWASALIWIGLSLFGWGLIGLALKAL
jgi:hypothetical protein